MKSRILFAITLLILSSLACSIVLSGTPAAPPPAAITQIVIVPGDTSTSAPPPVIVPATDTPQAPPPIQPLPTLTPNPTATATSAFPIARLIKNANCRSGPGTAYNAVTSYLKDQVLEIVGRNADFNNTWWLVKMPGSNGKCWVSLATALATGDFGSIPIILPPY